MNESKCEDCGSELVNETIGTIEGDAIAVLVCECDTEEKNGKRD